MIKLPNLEDCVVSEKSKNGWVYDVESYPNFFCVSFFNGREHVQFEISERKNELLKIHSFINEKNRVLLGYNNSKFDDYVVGYINKNISALSLMKYDQTSRLLAKMCANTIDYFTNSNRSLEKEVKSLRRYNSFESIDLMKVYNIQKSLKLVAVSLKWNNIQDLPYHWNENLSVDKLEEVLLYNQNDTEITYALLKNIRKEIELRYNLSRMYEINVLSESDSGISNKLFESMYKKKTKVENFLDIRTHRSAINLADCVFSDVQFKTDSLKKVLENIKSITLQKNKKGFDFKIDKITIGQRKYVFGKGGLHSEDEPNCFEQTEEVFLVDSDVTSYYPTMMINKKVKPENLEDFFTDIMINLTQERVEAKKLGDKTKADGLKIVINSIFGKLGFEGFFLYDEQAMLSVTINGQLYLLMLIEMLHEKGYDVISANTDGVVTLVPKSKLEEYYSICKEWENKLNLNLEYTFYKKYVRKDVNNYLAETVDGKIKSKGAFLQEIDLKKGFNSPIISLALKKHFIDKVDVKTFITNHKDVFDFCMSERTGAQFKVEYDGKPVQKSVRYYASPKGKKLIKHKIENTKTFDFDGEEITEKRNVDLLAGKTVQLFNRFEEMDNYYIDYNYYIFETEKIIRDIEKEEAFLW